MDAVLNECKKEYEQPYYAVDLTTLCQMLLTLLPPAEQRQIQYGILDADIITKQ